MFVKRNVCVVTGSRADYGLLRAIMQGIRDSSQLNLQILVTGMHLSPEFGLTYQEIERDGFVIDEKVEMLISSDTAAGVSKSMGLGLIGISDALLRLRPDYMLLLGDRFEIFSAAASALISRIPIIHIHGGEITEGCYDDAIRHSITKMSQLHFVATEAYRRRVIQLGEEPDRVFCVGGLGVDCIKKTEILSKKELETALNFKFRKRNLLFTYNPVTLDLEDSRAQIKNILCAINELEETGCIITLPNADNGGRAIISMLREYAENNERFSLFTSLGQQRYYSCLVYVDGVIGNSSSGLLEVPSFKKGTINIGNRQAGRLRANSIIDCQADIYDIRHALKKLFSPEFQELLASTQNPYGEGYASDKIVEILNTYELSSDRRKKFFDLELLGY